MTRDGTSSAFGISPYEGEKGFTRKSPNVFVAKTGPRSEEETESFAVRCVSAL